MGAREIIRTGPLRGVPQLGALLATAALLVAACGSSSTSSAPPATTVPSLATLDVLSTAVDVQPTPSTTFAAAQSGQALREGDKVRTDPKGFAEVSYFDGSWMRVDTGATLTMKALADRSDADIVHTGIDTGRAWVKAEKLTSPDSSNELETPVGVAAVRGTVYSVDCTLPDACRFIVFDGVVEVRPLAGPPVTLRAGESVTIAKNTPPPSPEPVAFGDVAGPWVQQNLSVDRKKPGTKTSGTTAASGAVRPGIYDVTSTITDGNATAPVGSVSKAVWVVPKPCAAACEIVIAVDGSPTSTLTYQLAGGAMTNEEQVDSACFDPATGQTTSEYGSIQSTITRDYQISADGRTITGSKTQTAQPPASGPCAGGAIDPITWTVEGKLRE